MVLYVLEVTQRESKVKFKGIPHGRWNLLIFFSGVVGGNGTLGGSNAPGRKQLSLSLNCHSSPQSHGVSSSYSLPELPSWTKSRPLISSVSAGGGFSKPIHCRPHDSFSRGTVWKLQPQRDSPYLKHPAASTHSFGPPTQLHPSTPHRLCLKPTHMPQRPMLTLVFPALAQHMPGGLIQLAAIPSSSPASASKLKLMCW